MSVKVENLSGCKVKLSFVLKEEEFQTALDKAFEKEVVKAEVPGFRKGKVPKSVFLKKYGVESLYNTALDEAINTAFIDAIEKKKLEIVGEPKVDIDFTTLGEGKKLKFTIEVEVYPEVTLGEYKGVEVKKEAVKVTAKEVTEYINRILDQHAELEVVDGQPLEKGNTAVFDFDGSVDGVHFDGGKAENYSLEIGSGKFIPGFEDQMVGMIVGEKKDVLVKFPEDYQAENLKGKDAKFEVTLHEIKKRVLPKLTDAFVKEELEIKDVETVVDYKAYIKDIITKDKTEASENKFVDDLMTKVVENAKFDVPEAMVDKEVDFQVKQLENQAKMYNMPVDVLLKYAGLESLDVYKENVRPGALGQVKQGVVLDAIVKDAKLKVTDKDYEKEIKDIASQINKTEEETKKIYTKEAISGYILRKKAIDLIKDSAVTK